MLLNKHFIFLWRHQRRSVGDDVKHLLSSVTAPAQKVLNFLWILLINWSGTVPSSETLLHIWLNSTQPHFVWWVTAIDKFKGKETIKIVASESQQTFGLCCLIHSGTLWNYSIHEQILLINVTWNFFISLQPRLVNWRLEKSWYRATGGLPGAESGFGVCWMQHLGFAHISWHSQGPEGPCLWWAHEIMPAVTVSLCQEQHCKVFPQDSW